MATVKNTSIFSFVFMRFDIVILVYKLKYGFSLKKRITSILFI